MRQDKKCQSCPQGHDCKKVYEVMGKVEGPSIVVKVLFAFLVPLVVFIVCLAVFGRIFAGITNSEGLQTGLSVLAAAMVVFVVVLITKAISRRI